MAASSAVHSKIDEVRLWERETGRLFGTPPSPDDGVEFTCAAWNHASPDSLMLAAGGNDGSLRLWKAPPP
jgi:WD40 repeat protein